jgi:hypothetical protein
MDRQQRVFLFFIVLLGVMALIILFSLAARAQELDPDTCQEEGTCWIPAGGEPEPIMGSLGEPWKKMCAKPGEWCPSIAEGVSSGESWCSSDKCLKNNITKSYSIYQKWGPVIDEMCGAAVGNGQPGIWVSQTVRTEACAGNEGGKCDVFNMTKSGTKECGLASVTVSMAEELNINACDPYANLYATCYYRADRVIKMRDKLPDLEKAPLEDQWLIAGAGGAVGCGKVITLIQKSGALSTNKDGDLKHSSPYTRMITYIKGIHPRWVKAQKVYKLRKTMGLAGALKHFGYTEKEWKYIDTFGDVYSKSGDWSKVFGYRPGRTAFRIARPGRVAEIMLHLYPDGIPWGEPARPKRPEGLAEFPGKKKHCACGNWKDEYLNKVPSLEEYAEWKSSVIIQPLPPEEALELAYGG